MENLISDHAENSTKLTFFLSNKSNTNKYLYANGSIIKETLHCPPITTINFNLKIPNNIVVVLLFSK